MQSPQNIDRYVAQFEQQFSNGKARGPKWLLPIREAALANFRELGFPTTHDEDWKYTRLDRIVAGNFQPADKAAAVALDTLLARSFVDAAEPRIVFVDGFYSPQLSSLADCGAQVRVESLAQAAQRGDETLQARVAGCGTGRGNSLLALNLAFARDGAMVRVGRGCHLSQPIQIVFAATAGAMPLAAYPRNLIVCENGSEAQIVENYCSLAPGAYWTNSVTEVLVGADAAVDHYCIEREGDQGLHVNQLTAELARNGHFTAHAITLGGALVRNDVQVLLNGEGAECTLNGLYLLDGKQHVDNHTEIEHAQPHTSSRELYKGVLSGAAQAVFNGKIVVRKDAQKTDARQTNKNLLLSENGVVNTKPQLEIYADDVKCSHGSTIGQLDRDALFYLRSRGIGSADAQSLLSYAFASDVVSRIKIASLRERMDEYLLQRFGRS